VAPSALRPGSPWLADPAPGRGSLAQGEYAVSRVRRGLVSIALALGLAGGLLTAAGGAASADTSVALPWSTFSHVLADGHGHVFVTGGSGTTSVWVRDADGAAVTSITNMNGASGMALSADGSTLYVSLYDDAAVSAIDTTTLAEVHRYAMPSTCPDSVAVVGSALWVGITCDHQWSHLGNVDLGTGTVTDVVTSLYNPLLVADPADSGVLYVADRGESPSTLYKFTVSGTALTLAASVSPGDNLQDFALDPDGTHIVTACGSPYQHNKFLTSDLSADGSYASGTYPNAVAASTTNHVLALGVDGIYWADVYVYRSGSQVRTVDYPTNDEVLGAGLALSPDGSRLYAVTQTHTLHVIVSPGAAASSLAITAPATGIRGAAYTASAVLTSGGAPVVGAAVSATRVDQRGTASFSLVTDATGNVSAKDTPSVGGPATWTFSYAGDVDRSPVAAKKVVIIARTATVLSIATNAKSYGYGARATVTVHLGTTYNSRTVYVYALQYGSSTKAPGTLIAHGSVNRKGNLTVTFRMTRKTTFTAKFLGDYRYDSRTRTTAPSVTPKVSIQAAGYHSRSGSYYVYSTVPAYFRASTSPGRTSGCASFVAQRLVGATWKTVATLSCATVQSDGWAYAYFTNPLKGAKYRTRALVKSNSYSLAGGSGWMYFLFK